MTRLTTDLLARAEERVNPFGERELNLRQLGLSQIENLGALNDQFQCIDFSHNQLSGALGDGLPLMRRVRTLVLSHNSIDSVSPQFVRSVPDLTSLVLQHNFIARLEDVGRLAGLRRLDSLVLVGCPVVQLPGYRQFVIAALPQLQSLDYTRIRLKERRGKGGVSQAAAAVVEEVVKEDKENEENEENEEERRRRIIQAIESATTREEVARLENLLSLGLAPPEQEEHKRAKLA